MGYESRIYVVDKHEGLQCPSDKKLWGEVLSMTNLSKWSSVAEFFNKKPVTDCYIYADDGNTAITEDRYGKELTECSIDDFYDFLMGVSSEYYYLSNEDRKYRRYLPLLKLIEGYKLSKDRYENLFILHYGY